MLSDIRKLIIPEGWACIGYQIPKKGQGFVSASTGFFVVADMDFNDQSTSVRLCFRKVESVDTELEDAKKKFPVGSYFKTDYPDYDDFILPVTSVENRGGFGINIWSGKNGNTSIPCPIELCTPFPLPRWRCCESDRPKKTKNCFLRFKESLTPSHLDVYLDQIKGWERLHKGQADLYEWLDEGEL